MPTRDSEASPSNPTSTSLQRLLAIIAITIGYALNPLNGSLAVTAYPQLSDYFHVPYAHMSAMVMYFMAATAIGQPLAGGLGDLLGRKTIFLTGILGFTIASAMASAAQSFHALLLWRVTQAAFSGVIMANGMALIAQVATQDRVGSSIGFLNSAFVAATVVGFTLGGVLLQFFDWRMLFELNVVLGIVASALAIFFIPKDSRRKTRFTALSFIGIPTLPLALAMQALVQDTSPVPYVLAFLLAAGTLAVAIVRSRSSREQLRSFGNLRFNLGCFILLFSIATHFAIVFTLPAWAHAALGIKSGVLGMYFSIIAGSQVATSAVLGKIIDAYGDRLLRFFAILAIALPILIMVFYLNPISFAFALALFGAGMATAQLIAQRTSLLASTENSRALAMGIFSSYRSVGGLSGNALAAIVLASYPVITAESGVRVLEWGFALFVVPATLALWSLKKQHQPPR